MPAGSEGNNGDHERQLEAIAGIRAQLGWLPRINNAAGQFRVKNNKNQETS
jgi:hypothetical protein